MNLASGKIQKGDSFIVTKSGSSKPSYTDLKKVTPAGANFTTSGFTLEQID